MSSSLLQKTRRAVFFLSLIYRAKGSYGELSIVCVACAQLREFAVYEFGVAEV